MTPPLRYASAKALHDAIKVRVAAEAEHGRYDINQLRRHFAYDRFLTRLFLDPNSTWVLKGGTGLLARVPQHARHTQDIDLHYRGEIESAEAELIASANNDIGDFFSFDLEQSGTLTGTTSGRKYRVTSYVGDAKFADFQIDAVIDSNMTCAPDSAPGLRPIDIEGLTTADYRIYPVVDHLADKLVAMTSTFAGDRPSTRYRDLVDIVLIATRTPATKRSTGQLAAANRSSPNRLIRRTPQNDQRARTRRPEPLRPRRDPPASQTRTAWTCSRSTSGTPEALFRQTSETDAARQYALRCYDQVMANIEISSEVLDRIEAEAARRHVSPSDVLAELADTLPPVQTDGDRVTPAFVAAGSSGVGISNRIDELLADGFGRS